MKVISFYIIILIAFINSKDFQILDIEPYTNTYYVKDMIQRKEDVIIYKYEPEIENKNIFLLFFGYKNARSFDFYLYKNLSSIKSEDGKHFINYEEKFTNYLEINLNHNLTVYYILAKMKYYEDEYDYLSFMIYNSKEKWNIGNFEPNKEYIFGLERDREITLIYPAKNITQDLHLSIRGPCDDITYTIYRNNEETGKTSHDCKENHYKTLTFVKNDNYEIHLSFRNENEIILRFVFYFLTNKKNIFEIKDFRTDIKYGYVSYINGDKIERDCRYYFINFTDYPMKQSLGYSLIEPFNLIKYQFYYKRYTHYDINKLPNGEAIKDFDYYYSKDEYISDEPFKWLNRKEDTKGIFLKIESHIVIDGEYVGYGGMLVYLYPKLIFEDLTENHKFNHTELKEKNVFDLSNKKGNFIMKSNLDYFTILYPSRKRIWSTTYLFEETNFIFELQNSENASVEFQYAKETVIANLSSPYMDFLCKNNIKEEKILYLPYMTDFNILFGDIKVYDIDVDSLNSLDDFYGDKYLKVYNSDKRYDNYKSSRNVGSFYKLKCNKYSLLKFDDSFKSTKNEKITINKNSKKLILDFILYEQMKINFESKLSLYIGILNSQELKENWSLIFYINDEKYSINNTNNTFFHEFNTQDTLKIDKPNNTNIHPYINVMNNYNIEKVRPLRTNSSGIFVFDKNYTEEYDVLINISFSYKYYSSHGKYSLFYGDPKNYEYNQLISNRIEISNNPYKYLEKNDKNKYFFILYNNYSNEDEFRISKLSKKNIEINEINELTLIEKPENEVLKLYFPKVNETTHGFIQYFYEEMDVYKDDGIKLKKKNTHYSTDRSVKEYIFYANNELYASNENIKPYKTFFLVSYVNITHYHGKYGYTDPCEFKITNTNDTFNDIIIEIHNECKSKFHYYIFILYNNSDYYNSMTPLELFYEKKNNNSIKCHELTTNGNLIEIKDNFIKGKMNITIVGQSDEGFRRFVFTRKEYDYIGNKKSYLAIIILGCIAGAIIIIIVIVCVVKHIKKRKMNSLIENMEDKALLYKVEEKNNNNERGSADFDNPINGTPYTPTPTSK